MNKKLLDKTRTLVDMSIPFSTATIVGSRGSTPRKIGAKMLVYLQDGIVDTFDTIGGGKLEKIVIEDALGIIKANIPTTKEYKLDESADATCGGSVDVYFEPTGQNSDVYIFGAGHVGSALSKTLSETPFCIHLIDEREKWVQSPELPKEIVRHHMMYDQFIEKNAWNLGRKFVVIMTHDHKHDQDILECIIDKNPFHIGLMGSANKWKIVQENLIAKGLCQEKLNQVYCPIGDKKLGEGPKEIAIGIAAQLLSIYNNPD